MSSSAFPIFLADIYIPFLAVLYLRRLHRCAPALRTSLLCLLLANLAIAWGMMFADQLWAIWPAWGLDYSTHTAIALAFVIGFCVTGSHQSPCWVTSLVLYATLMMALDYHSLADIVSTAAAVGTPMLALGHWRCRPA